MSNTLANYKFKELLLPTILIAMALNITGIIDSVFISNYIGDIGLSALESLEPLISLITVFELMFGLGGEILSLNKKAEFDEKGSNHYFTVAVIASFVLCVLAVIICAFDLDFFISILRATPESVPYIKQYAPFLFLCIPVSAVVEVLTQYIRIDGQPKFATKVVVVSNVINIILDYFLLAHFNMGMEGAAFASFAGYVLGLVLMFKYYKDPKRTFKLIPSEIPVKKWFTSTFEICKVAFPTTTIGIFDAILIYALNILVGGVLGDPGLVAYNLCVESLLLVSIIIVGISDTLTSMVPVYYSQDDYKTINELTKKSVFYSLIFAVLYSLFIWIWPEGYLMIYGLNNISNTAIYTNALRFFAILFIPSVFATILIYYYEAIERTAISTVMSVIATLAGPLAISYLLYPVLGIDIVWSSFGISCIIAPIIGLIYAKIVERRDHEYHGVYFIKQDILERSTNYRLENPGEKSDMIRQLESLNISEKNINNVDTIVDRVFELNGNDIVMEILLINYDDEIKLNFKYSNPESVIEDVKKDVLDDENLKYGDVLGFKNLEYVIAKS